MVLLVRALLILALGFVALLIARFGAIHRRQIMARWPALACGTVALVMLWRGALGPALGFVALSVAAWFLSPSLLRRATASPTLQPPAEAEARAILGVGLAATPDEIRAAYRRKIAVAHPDRGGSH